MREVLMYKASLCKDQVEMGRLSGLTNQENIRKIKSKIGQLGCELERLESENERLKAVISTVNSLTSMTEQQVL